jgi:hypothetical protein
MLFEVVMVYYHGGGYKERDLPIGVEPVQLNVQGLDGICE